MIHDGRSEGLALMGVACASSNARVPDSVSGDDRERSNAFIALAQPPFSRLRSGRRQAPARPRRSRIGYRSSSGPC